MLSKETKEEVIELLLESRYTYINDIKIADCFYGIAGFKPIDEMTDEEIIAEYEDEYHIDEEMDDELYDCMIAEMEAHKMLTPTVPIDDEQ